MIEEKLGRYELISDYDSYAFEGKVAYAFSLGAIPTSKVKFQKTDGVGKWLLMVYYSQSENLLDVIQEQEEDIIIDCG